MAIFAWSDLHTDYSLSLERIAALSQEDYRDSTVLLAGDISHQLSTIDKTFRLFTQRFRQVFFVPGNHDLWLFQKDFVDSLQKLDALQGVCDECGVLTTPATIRDGDAHVQIMPLLSWYRRPEHGTDSLYIPKIDDDPTLKMWMDNYRILWPQPLNEDTIVDHFNTRNWQAIKTFARDTTLPMVSMSHFLPHGHLMFEGEPVTAITAPIPHDPYPAFNFSRVAGSTSLLTQITALQSNVHVYGHQHRNRWRKVDGVWCVSHCLGYPQEPQFGKTGDRHQPAQVWPIPQQI